ncbi:MAG: hypothetical protein AAGF90_15025, partial [Pseudomonadota bacterium]
MGLGSHFHCIDAGFMQRNQRLRGAAAFAAPGSPFAILEASPPGRVSIVCVWMVGAGSFGRIAARFRVGPDP